MNTIDGPILVVYASRHGATQAIADRIATTLTGAGHRVDLRAAHERLDVSDYDTFVIGSAIHGNCWLRDASDFVDRNIDHLTTRPVWLFSSGPLGTDTTDAAGRDLRTSSVPTDVTEFSQAIHPRDHRVFFGALDAATLSASEKAVRRLPALRGLMPEGDFRNWAQIEAWARDVAAQARQPDPPTGRTKPCLDQ